MPFNARRRIDLRPLILHYLARESETINLAIVKRPGDFVPGCKNATPSGRGQCGEGAGNGRGDRKIPIAAAGSAPLSPGS
jgi:hypothetical protein